MPTKPKRADQHRAGDEAPNGARMIRRRATLPQHGHPLRPEQVAVPVQGISEVIQRSRGMAVLGLEAGHSEGQVRLVEAFAAVLRDHHAAQDVERADEICFAESHALGEQRLRERPRVAGGLGRVDQAIGDTLSAGGLMDAQRAIPVMLDICRDIREVRSEERRVGKECRL